MTLTVMSLDCIDGQGCRTGLRKYQAQVVWTLLFFLIFTGAPNISGSSILNLPFAPKVLRWLLDFFFLNLLTPVIGKSEMWVLWDVIRGNEPGDLLDGLSKSKKASAEVAEVPVHHFRYVEQKLHDVQTLTAGRCHKLCTCLCGRWRTAGWQCYVRSSHNMSMRFAIFFLRETNASGDIATPTLHFLCGYENITVS